MFDWKALEPATDHSSVILWCIDSLKVCLTLNRYRHNGALRRRSRRSSPRSEIELTLVLNPNLTLTLTLTLIVVEMDE